jgi:hypothetical protein
MAVLDLDELMPVITGSRRRATIASEHRPAATAPTRQARLAHEPRELQPRIPLHRKQGMLPQAVAA